MYICDNLKKKNVDISTFFHMSPQG